MRKKQEPKAVRTMRIVRAWLPNTGQFKYYVLYSDGDSRPSSKKEALQYTKAYKQPVETVFGAPGGRA